MIYSFVLIPFIVTFSLIIFLTILANKYNIIDKQDERKIHSGDIPLVGGLAIFFSLVICSFILNLEPIVFSILLASFFIVIIGFIDDVANIKVSTRFFFQIIATVYVISNNFSVTNLGLYDNKIFYLYQFGYLFTIFSVLILINAINFIDGIDGLGSSTVLVALIGLFIFTYFNNNHDSILISIFFTSVFVFFIFNLGFIKNFKIFLGDSGSTFLGFYLAWILVYYAEINSVHPALIIWTIAFPCYDMLRVIIKRSMLKINPLNPDRIHAHHVLLKIINNEKLVLIILILVCFLFLILGASAFYFFGPLFSILFFIILFFIYFYIFEKLQ